MGRIVAELLPAGGQWVLPARVAPLDGSVLNYRQNAGFAGGAIQWGPFMCIQLEPDPRDANEGIDNDSKGSSTTA